MNDSQRVEALDRIYTFPREVGWKIKFPDGRAGFTRNRYVHSAEELDDVLSMIQYDFFASVYSFTDDVMPQKPWNRETAIIDRIFFDFDSEDPKAALKETKKLVDALEAKPIVVFSGKKGFHVYTVFEGVQVRPIALKSFALLVVEKLKLKTCDPAVFEVARLSRVPFSIHSATNLPCTIISPERIKRMTFNEVLKFVKEGKWDFPDFEIYSELSEFLKAHDLALYEEEVRREELRKMREPIKSNVKGDWRKRRIAEYTEALRRYGRLVDDPRIRARHALNPWVAEYNKSIGAVEHLARVHFVLLMIEEGYTDEQIHEVMKFAHDYDYERTQYYIDYNRKRKADERV